MGLVYKRTNQVQLAADHLRRAIDALEAQVGKLGGSQETQSGFGAQFADYYRDYIDLLIETNQPTEAFHVLERSRARTLLAMLAERDLVFTADVPEEIERERKRIAWEYDQAQARLAKLNPLKEQTQIDALLNQIRELRDRQSDIVEQIRQQSPRLASLQYPQPLDVKGVQAALDPGTLLLSYSVGKDKSYLFALTADAGVAGLYTGRWRDPAQRRHRAVPQPDPARAARRHGSDRAGGAWTTSLRRADATGGDDRRARATRADCARRSAARAAVCERWFVVARRTPRRARRDWQYLVEWKPVHVVVSATVYAEVRKARQTRGGEGPSQDAGGLRRSEVSGVGGRRQTKKNSNDKTPWCVRCSRAGID